MIEKEQKFILFASNKQSDHLKLYIDAELKAIDGTWCFFCHNKLNKKNGKNFQNWSWVKNNEDFEKVKLVANKDYDYKFADWEAVPRFFYVCNKCFKTSSKHYNL